MIAVVDSGSGNIGSVLRALDHLGLKSVVASCPESLNSADRLLLPGVGNFAAVMAGLRQRGFATVLPNLLHQGMPFFGICVGLQVLFESSEESRTGAPSPGLGIIKGTVKKFAARKVPQIGWNTIEHSRVGWLRDGDYVYYVNSYYAVPEDPLIVAATSSYGIDFCAALQIGNIRAVQFHPEKSGKAGLEVLKMALI